MDRQAISQGRDQRTKATAQQQIRAIECGGSEIMQAHARKFRRANLRTFPMRHQRIKAPALRRGIRCRAIRRAIGGGGFNHAPEAILGRGKGVTFIDGGKTAFGE